MAGGQINFKVGYTVDKTGLNELRRSLTEIITTSQLPGNKMNQGLQQAAGTARQLSVILDQCFNKELGTLNVTKFNQALKQSQLSVSQLKASLSQTATGAKAFNQLGSQILGTNIQLRESNKLLDSMAETMGNTIKWGIASSIMNTFSKKVQDAYGHVKNLDKSLNNIRIVTSKSADEMERFAEKANSAAKNLGAKTTDFTNAALIYYQQGLDDAESSTRAEITVKTANITKQSADEVSEQLTAVWNGYKVDAAEAELYVDKLAAVAATTASDLEELSTGMSKVASAANSMGVDIDQLNAQLATIVSVTRQAPESVGTALKTIYARMGDLAVEGTDEFGTSLGEISGKMQQMGIQILDGQGNLRDMGVVIEETAKKWETWTEAQRQAAAVAIAGKRQYNNLIALFENWDMYTEALETSTNAMGTLNKQNDIYLESTEAKLNELRATWEDLYDSVFDTGELNTGIEAVTQLVQVFDNFMDSFGGGTRSILAFGTLVANIFNKQISKAISKATINQMKYNANMELLKNKKAYIDEGVAKNGSTPENKAAEAGYKKQLEYARQIQQIQSQLTDEEYQQLINQQKQVGLLEEERVLLEERALQGLKNNGLTPEQVEGEADIENLVNNEASTKTKSSQITKQNNALREIAVVSKETLSTEEGRERALKNINGIMDRLKQQEQFVSQEEKEQLQSLNARLGGLKSSLEQAQKEGASKRQIHRIEKEILQITEEIENTENGIVKAAEKRTKAGEEYYNAMQRGERSKAQQQDIESEMDLTIKQGQVAMDTSTKVMTISSALSTVAMAWSSVNSMFQVWNDETASLGEKITQSLMTVGMLIPSILMTWKELKAVQDAMLLTQTKKITLDTAEISSTLGKVTAQNAELKASELKNLAESKGILLSNKKLILYALNTGAINKETAAKLLNAGSTNILTKAVTSLTIAMSTNPLLAWALALTAVVAGVAVLVKVLGDNETALEAAEKKMKSASETTKQMASDLAEAQNAYKNLKSEIENYSKSADALANLTKGTTEWKMAVLELNQQVLTLLKQYPQLASFISNKGGVLSISEEGFDAILEEQRQRAETSQSAYTAATIEEEKAKKNYDVERLKQEIEWSVGGSTELIQNTAQAGGLGTRDENDFAKGKYTTDFYRVFEPENLMALGFLNDDDGDITYKELKTFIDDEIGFEKLAKQFGISEDDLTKVLQYSTGYIDEIPDNLKQHTKLLNALKTNVLGVEQNTKKIVEVENRNNELVAKSLGLQSSLSNNEDFIKMDSKSQNIVANLGATSKVYEDAEKAASQEVDTKMSENPEEQTSWVYEQLVGWGYEVEEGSVKADANGITFRIAGEEEDTTWTMDHFKTTAGTRAGQDAVNNNLDKVLKEYEDATAGENDILANFVANGGISNGEIDLTKMTAEEVLALQQNDTNAFKNGGKLANLAGWKGGADNLNNSLNDAIQNADIADLFMQQATAGMAKAKESQSALSTLAAEGYDKLSDSQKAVLVNLEEEYSALKEIGELQGRNSHEYLTMLRDIKEAQEDAARGDLVQAQEALSNKLEDAIKKGTGKDGKLKESAIEGINQILEDIQKNQFELEIAIKADIQSDIEDGFGIAEEFNNLQDLITDDLTYTMDEVKKISAQGYGEIFKNATDAGNGEIKVNKAVLDNFINNEQAKIEASKQAKIEELQQQLQVLGLQKKALENKKKALIEALNAETAADAAAALAKAQNAETEYNSQVLAMNELLNAESDKAFQTGEVNESLYDALGGMYVEDAENQVTAEEEAAKVEKEILDGRIQNVKSLYSAWRTTSEQIAGSATGTIVDWDKDATKTSSVKPSTTVSKSKGVGGVDEGVFKTEGITAENLQDKFDFTDKTSESYTQYQNTIKTLIKQTDNEIDSIEDTEGSIYAVIAAMNASGKALDKAQAGAGKTADLLENEIDLYHDINIEIQQLANEMSKLEKQQEKLYGQDLLNNLQKQLDLLEKQEDAERRKLAIAQQEASTLKNSLAAQGTTFNADGTVSNYQALYAQKLAETNAIIASGDEEAAEKAKAAFEKWQEEMERYDQLLTEEIPGLEESVQDKIDAAIEKKIEAFKAEIEIKLDFKDAERDWYDFKKNMTIDEDDILGNTKFALDKYKTYFGDGGTITELKEQSKTLLDQLAQMDSTGTSSIYGDNRAKLMEDIAQNQEDLMAALQEQKDLLDEIEQSYIDMLDKAQEAFDEQIAQYEAINEVYSHGLNVINLLYGEDAYAEMEGFYQKQMENNNQMIDMQKKSVEYYKGLLENTNLTDEQRKEVQKKLQEAQAGLNASVESQLELIVTKYQNAIKKIFDEFEDQMTGGKGMAYIQEEWDLINQNADMYLDQVNSGYEVDKLSRSFDKAIDSTSSLTAQKRLNELKEKELKNLREKDKLTQYEVDRANALLDIELKKIALEEAQQNKSKMRLRRDASGNYSYQFVSDEDAVAQAEQEVRDAENSLYNLDKDALKENQEAALNIYNEFKEKYIEIMSDVTLSEEEREARIQMIREQYGQMYNDILEQNAIIRENTMESSLQAMSGLNQNYLLEEIVPTWDIGVQQMIDKFTAEGGLNAACTEAFGAVKQATSEYESDLGLLESTAGTSFGNMAQSIEDLTVPMQQVLDDNDALIQKYQDEIDAIEDIQLEMQELIDLYKDATREANAAVDAMLRARQVKEENDAADDDTGDTSGDTGDGNTNGNTGGGTTTPSLSEGTQVTVKTTATHFSRDGGNGTRMKSFVPGSTYGVMQISGNEVLIGKNGVATGWVNKTDLIGFNTGGYTGDWSGDGGRLAFLHKKELILNKQDTKNILQAVDVVRQIDGIMSSIMGNAFDRINNQVRGLNSMSFPVGRPTSSEAAVAQHIEINADFPGVEKASEIISAFENLTNMATQYAFRTDR